MASHNGIDPNAAIGRLGKTPPPAPSSLFSKRAREIQSEALQNEPQPYRPPAMRNGFNDVADSENHPSGYSASFRRARAGTLPSNLTAAARDLYSHSTNALSQVDDESLTSGASSPVNHNYSQAGQLYNHSTTSSSLLTTPSSSSSSHMGGRNRSGSLTLPKAGLSHNAFGPSMFSSSNWVANQSPLASVAVNSHTTTSGTTYQGMNPFHSNESLGGDDNSVLDYLGLADGTSLSQQPQQPTYTPASLSELRNQTQQQILGNSRARAATMSNSVLMRSRLNGLGGYDGSNSASIEINGGSGDMSGGNDAYSMYSGPPKSFKDSAHLSASSPNRHRSISVGTLDDHHSRIGLDRLNNLSSLSSSQYSVGELNPSTATLIQGLGSMSLQPPPPQRPFMDRPHSERDLSVGRSSASGLFGGSNSSSTTPRAITPDVMGNQQGFGNGVGGSGTQTPSRSLWIGNLDPGTTSQELMHVFAPYGAIESLRLLPDKDCGFVNFVDKGDAIRAKDDGKLHLLNRLGGHISASGSPVRIGFGKIDSAPAGPAGVVAQQNAAFMGYNGGENASQVSPTRALWIGSIPSSTTPGILLTIFSPYGPIESARVLTHKNCGFVNFERLDSAMVARKALNGRDILGPEVGAIRIGFARVPVKAALNGDPILNGAPFVGTGDLSVGATIHALRQVQGVSSIPADQQVLTGSIEDFRSNLVLDLVGTGEHVSAAQGTQAAGGAANPVSWQQSVTEQQMIMKVFSEGSQDGDVDTQEWNSISPPAHYYTNIPLISERGANRKFDANKLRELKKKLDSPSCAPEEVEDIAVEIMDEVVELASDHIGNTVVQKLFEKGTTPRKLEMLERIAPHLAMIGIHKNGTWSTQKIIDCATTPEETSIICQNLAPYTPPLLLDQFGNYVISICMRFGSPANDFIFDAMCDRMWDIAQGRYGARSLRTCLESTHTTSAQKKRVAAAIILNSIPLATNPNGALLLTWLADTSNLHGRYRLLAPRFAPHLSHLCTHKLASINVLRIINQDIDPGAAQTVIDALFQSPNDQVLTDILGDQVHGVNVVQKIISSQKIDDDTRSKIVEATKRVLANLKVTSSQSYRRILEEVGLPFTPGPSVNITYGNNNHHGTYEYRGNNNSRQYNQPHHHQHQHQQQWEGYPQPYDPSILAMGQNLQPSLSPQYTGVSSQGQSFGQTMMGGQPGSPVQAQVFSPTSDPFNPFSSPTRTEARLNSYQTSGSPPSDPGRVMTYGDGRYLSQMGAGPPGAWAQRPPFLYQAQ